MKTIQLVICGLLLTTSACFGQGGTYGPGWINASTMGPVTNAPSGTPAPGPLSLPNVCGPFTVTSQTGQAIISEAVTPEITALAANLQNDPKRIFDYVHNKIQYVHYFGSKKGALMTLLEGSGNDFDQCGLLVALIRAASTNSGNSFTTHYQFGLMQIPYSASNNVDLQHWLGLSMPGGTIALFSFLDNIFGQRGYPVYDTNYTLAFEAPYQDASFNNIIFQRLWVRLTVGSTDYYLDPALKLSTVTSGINVTNAMGFSATDVFSGVGSGATVTSDYVQHLNWTNLNNKLTSYTTNLLGYLKTNPNRSVEQVIGGYDIQSSITTNLPSCLAFAPISGSFQSYSGSFLTIPTLEWDNIPTNYMSAIQLQVDSINTNYYFPALQTRKLSLTFTNISGVEQAQIALDDVVQTTGTGGTGVNATMTTTVTHPFGQWNYTSNKVDIVPRANQSDNGLLYQRAAAGYVVTYGFDDVSQLLVRRQQKLNALLSQGISSTDPRVVTETLNVMGLSWQNQLALTGNSLGAQKDVMATYTHRVGRVAQETSTQLGFYVDLKLNFFSFIWRDGLYTDASNPESNLYHYTLFTGSALEHGVLEQLQANTASSTIKTLYLANQSGQKLILATNSGGNNLAAVLTLLQGETISPYTSAIQNSLANTPTTNPPVTMLLPSGLTTVNQWKGYGYANLSSGGTSLLMAISGGYSGGFAGTQEPVNPPLANNTYTTSPMINTTADPTLGATAVADPLNMLDGSFMVDSIDLDVGQSAPRGFSFARHYDSNRRSANSATMANGWIHNYIINAMTRSDPDAAMGRNTPQEMAAFLVGSRVGYEIFSSTPTTGNPQSECWAVGALCAEWSVDGLTNNAVSVTLGTANIQFLKQPNGSYTPPAGITMSLLRTNSAYQLQMRHGNLFQFGTNGLLANIIDQYGQSNQLTYNPSNWLSKVTDWKGRILTFQYVTNAPSHLASISDSTGRSVSYGYTSNANGQLDLTSVIDAQGFTNSYVYDTNHQIIAAKDNLSQVTSSNIYDGFGHVIVQYSQGDTNKMWQGFWNGTQNTLIDPAGGQQLFFYDAKSRLIASEDALGNFSQKFYDGQDHVVVTVSPLNETNQFIYDGNDNLVGTIDPLGFTNGFVYDTSFNLTKTFDALGHSNTFGYNLKFQLISSTNGAGDWVTNFYDPTFGFLRTRTDSGGTTGYGYDGLGQLSSVTNAGNLGTSFFVNSTNGDVLLMTNANGFTNGFIYNARRQLVQSTGPTNRTSKIIYDVVGNVASNVDYLTHATTFTWSPTRHLLTTTLPLTPLGPTVITNAYDVRDWLIKTVDPLQLPTTNAYDLAGRLLSVTDPLLRPTTMTYDDDGRSLTVKNATNQGIIQEWNVRGQLTNTFDQAGQPISRGYDGAGNLLSLTNRLLNYWTFQYDAANRLTVTTSPLTYKTTQVWNNRGLLQSIIDAKNQTNNFGYDPRGLLSSRTDNVAVTTFQYDFNGNRTNVIEAGKSNVWTLDAYDRPIIYTDSAGNQIKYGYDTNGNLTSLVYPGPRTVTYTYDNLNRLTTITDWAGRNTIYTYDLDSRLVTTTRPNGTVGSNYYDNGGQLTTIVEQAASHAPIAFFKLKWNTAARVDYEFAAPTNQAFSPPTRTMTYDQDNRLATFNGLSIVNDNNGNMTSGPLIGATNFTTYGYDARNRLTGVAAVGSSPTLGYIYDPANNRVGVTNVTSTNFTSFVIDSKSAQVLMRTKNGLTTYYVYGLGLVYEENDTTLTTNVLTYHFDSRGSTVALTDTNGNVTDRVQYSAYGMTTLRVGTNDTPFLYNGSYGVQTDPNGLLYMRARYYNPYICRFSNADPSGFGGGLNMYAFADGNPISETDPFGLGAGGGNVTPSWVQESLAMGMIANQLPGSMGTFAAVAGNYAANYQFFGDSHLLALNQTLNPFTSAEERFGESVDGISYQIGDTGQTLSTGSRVGSAVLGVVDTGAGVLQSMGIASTINSIPALTVSADANALTTVSRWGSQGIQSGDWVMDGPANMKNYILSGKYQPASWPGNNIPASFSSGQNFTVPASTLQTPPGFWGGVKGLLGQRIYQPPP